MINPRTYGFSKTDAEELVQIIGNGDVEFPEGRLRGRSGKRYVEEVRWADPVLEYRIGDEWFTIDTAVDCGPSVINGGTP